MRGRALTTLQGFELVQCAGPVRTQKARQTAVGEHLAAGLAFSAVVGFVVSVTNTLHLFSATRARHVVAAVYCHLRTKCGDFLWKAFQCLGAESIDPEIERGARCRKEALPLFWFELVGLSDGRKLSGVENFVGVRVTDTTDEARIRECALERAVFDRQCGTEAVEVGREDFNAAGIDGLQRLVAAQNVQRSAAFGAGFGEDEGT